MMVNAILVVQDQFTGFSDQHTNWNEYFQNFSLYIGDSTDWNENEKCPGWPYMTTADSDSWYNDERTCDDSGCSRHPGNVWTYGTEVWCNIAGQYVHIVADLRHLLGTYTMSLCSIGIMGTSFTRNEPLPDFIELFQKESMEIAVPHIFDEFTSIREQVVQLKQASSSELPFVAISEASGQSIIHVDPGCIAVGVYELKLQSYDTLSRVRPTLKSDTIQISVKSPFTFENQLISITAATEPLRWALEFDLDVASQVEIEVPPDLARFLTFEDQERIVSFAGDESSILSGTA